jgi:iron complex outermembrane recepter protein
MKKSLFIFVFFILAFSFVYGQKEKDDKDTMKYYLNTEIVVTAPRMNLQLKNIPFSTSVVTSEEINTFPRLIAVDEALKLVPGVKIDNQADGMRIHMSIRGQGILSERGIRGIKILYDGLPLNDPSGFAPDFFDIDFSTVDKIEVLRGPAASLYGGSSSGGIINIISKNAPLLKPYFGEGQLNYGSTNFWKALGRFGGSFNKFNYTVNFSRNMGEGYRLHTHYQGDNIYAKANIIPSGSFKITPILSYIDVYHENAEGINLAYYKQNPKFPNDDAIPFNEYLETKRFTGGFTSQVNLQGMHLFDFSGFYKNTKFTEANNHTFNDRIIDNFGGTLQYTLNVGKTKDMLKNHFSVGTDIQSQKINEKRVQNDHTVRQPDLLSNEDIKQTGLGIFGIEKLDIGKFWSVMLSARYDKIKNELTDLLKSPFDASGNADFNNTTGRFGATYAPIEEANFFANWGMGFLPPATEELAQNPDNFGGFNTHLTYAKSNGFDFGVRGTIRDMFYYDVTGFYLKTENDFDRYRLWDNPLRNQETFYQNTGASNRIGVELYSKFTPIRPLKIELAYTFSSFKYKLDAPARIMMDDTSIHKSIQDGNYLPNSPQHQLYIDIQYTELLPHITVGISGEALSKWYIDGANLETEAAEGYALLHARIVYTAKLKNVDYELSFNVKNIADKQYLAFTEPDPGGNAYQPASRRQFFGGLKIRF